MIGRNTEGDVTFTIDDRDELVSTLKEILTSTEIGKLYKTEYFVSKLGDEDAAKMVAAAQQIAGGSNISIRHLTRALELLIDSGELQPKNVAQALQLSSEPEEDLRPRDKNGKLLTPEQLAWGEMTRFAETATPDAIRQRRHTDHVFGEFVRTNLRREMSETAVGDAVTPAGQPTTKARTSKDIEAFAQKFLVEPSSNLRPKNGMVSLGGELIPWNTFQDLLNKATAAGAI
jgi:hypothetical protein